MLQGREGNKIGKESTPKMWSWQIFERIPWSVFQREGISRADTGTFLSDVKEGVVYEKLNSNLRVSQVPDTN